MKAVTILGVCTLPLPDTDMLVTSPAFAHKRNKAMPERKSDTVMIPMEELEGTTAERRKKAYDLVDKAIDGWDEFNLIGRVPAGTIGVWGEKEEK